MLFSGLEVVRGLKTLFGGGGFAGLSFEGDLIRLRSSGINFFGFNKGNIPQNRILVVRAGPYTHRESGPVFLLSQAL